MVTRADHVPGPRQGEWTYSHYAALDDGQRYEIIDGVLYMPPAPSWSHQGAVVRFAHYLLTYIEFAGLGKVSVAPTDVELEPGTVVQPDALVVLKANLHKVTPSRVIGAPDLVVEIASPGTRKYDWHEKYMAYSRAGVPEYWIVNPRLRTIEVLVLEGDTYQSLGVFKGKQRVCSLVIPAIGEIRVEQFFPTLDIEE
jgi:Uma2 family endonuclease